MTDENKVLYIYLLLHDTRRHDFVNNSSIFLCRILLRDSKDLGLMLN